MDTTETTASDPAAQRLASEVADVEASIALVVSGVATEVTLTGLRFGPQLAADLKARAASEGVDLEASFWPEEDCCDLRVSRMDGRDTAGETVATHV
jgi:hypothetical protein